MSASAHPQGITFDYTTNKLFSNMLAGGIMQSIVHNRKALRSRDRLCHGGGG